MIQKGKRYLVTGGAGFLGKSLVRELMGMNCLVNVMSRNEGQLMVSDDIIRKFPGDVANECDLIKASKGCDGIFHLAAFKHVTMAEDNVSTCISSNVIGSWNVLKLAQQSNQIKFVIGISTDKAVQISGVYGSTKFLMEKMFKEFEGFDINTKYRIVRYGNVLYSTGSVLCKWKDLLENGKDIKVTNPDSTRFYWTREQAVDLIFQCLDEAKSSTPFIPSMKSIKLGTLARAMLKKYGNGKTDIKFTNLEGSENLHERILEMGPTSNEVDNFTFDEVMKMI